MTTVQPEIPRDGYKRPLVVPPKGGKPVAYTRCTTYVGGIEDTYKLNQWQQRHVAIGLAANPDLLSAVGQADLNDRDRLNVLCDAAKDAAGASDSAALGTWLHAVTEAVDRGANPDALSVPPMPPLSTPRDAVDYMPDVAAYIDATAELTPVAIEAFTVLDNLKIGGTPDRIVTYKGKRYIADLKTGSIEYGALKIAAQLAVYARSALYDWQAAAKLTGQLGADEAAALRSTHGASVEKGIVIHMPAGSGTCRLYWVDLLAGWEAVRVCRSIREQRNVRFRSLMEPVPVTPIDPASLPVEPVADGDRLFPGENESDRAAREVEGRGMFSPPAPVVGRSLANRIDECRTYEELSALWADNADAWTDDLTNRAKARVAALGR